MNEQKDDLLAAFENPEMAEPAPVEQPTAAPAQEVASVTPVSASPEVVAPVTQETAQPTVDNIMPPEFQNAPEATPIPQASPVAQTEPSVASTPEVAQAPAAAPTQETVQAPETANAVPSQEVAPTSDNSGMQNVPEQVSEEPAVNVTQEIKNEAVDEDPNYLKKNIKFLLLFVAIIAVFMIFLPQITQLISGSAY